jgi:hypothetical protein
VEDIGKQVADAFVRRAQRQNMRGKPRDSNALEFFAGAAAAHPHGSPEQERLLMLATVIAIRGFGEVERIGPLGPVLRP